jgi:hypothetical protein
MNKALIISPTGCPIHFSDEYDRQNHWRFAKPGRSYDILLVPFNDFEPEPGTYDHLIKMRGRKFHIIRDLCRHYAWEDYDYIGTWDDDYATDIQSVERSLALARRLDFRVFQQSMISFNSFDCLKHDPALLFSETNFVESGIPFFRNDIFRKFLRFLNDYTYKESEWGIDKILCDLIQASAHVVHEVHAKHCRPESWYDKNNAFAEMHYLTNEFFPKYMKEKFNIDYKFHDRQVTINRYARTK